MRRFDDLTEQEILALAISLEEDDQRTYDDLAHGMRESYPGTAKLFQRMSAEEADHRHALLELYRDRFGEHIPLIRRHDVDGFVRRRPVWLNRPLGLERVRQQAELMELETARFYGRAAKRCTDAAIRQLLNDLATAERDHEILADKLGREGLEPEVRKAENEASRRLFLLQVVQPGLAGLMDGSVSTLAPLFAAAFATHSTWAAFLVGIAASLGAGISMGFAEALSDNGTMTGRGEPWLRGLVSGGMTALGGIGHTLPFLIPVFPTATAVAIAVVIVELALISWVRHRFMQTSMLGAAFQIGLGGAVVFAFGVLIGSG